MKIGFIGQGWIGKNYADDFERRGYDVVRYGLEPEYAGNAEAIADCEIVFIAVPTPTTCKGFDLSIVRQVLRLVGENRVAVIKSTILPGSTELLQSEFPWLYVLHSPEFLTEATAARDAAEPKRNIVGVPTFGLDCLDKAALVHSILPYAPYRATIPAAAAELVKYAGNALLYTKVVFANLLYNLAEQLGLDWSVEVAPAIAADPRIGPTHLEPVSAIGRGAGGHCFIKDFAALTRFYHDMVEDPAGWMMLAGIEAKNLELLETSGKDRELARGVYC